MFCRNCGNVLTENDKYCMKCGTEVITEDISEVKAMMQQVQPGQKEAWHKQRKNKLLAGLLIVLVLVFLIVLGGLLLLLSRGDFKHLGAHTFREATCTEPETCRKCGMTRGEKEEHDWKEATCTEPKTCEECGKTKGEAEGHLWGKEDVETRVCERCGIEEAPAEEAAVEVPVEEVTSAEEAAPAQEAPPAEVKGNMTLSQEAITILEAASLCFFDSRREGGYFSVEQLSGELQNGIETLGNYKRYLIDYFLIFKGWDNYDSYLYFDSEYCQKYVLYGAFEDAKRICTELFYVDLLPSDFVQDEKESSYDSLVLYSPDYGELVWSNGSDGFMPVLEYLSCTYNEATDLYEVLINSYCSIYEGQSCFYLKESRNNSFGFEIVGVDWKLAEEALLTFLGEGETEEYTENGITYRRYRHIPAYWEDGSEIYYEDLMQEAEEFWEGTDWFWREEIWLDFDNDGEIELYLPNCDYYGGMIFDARGGNVYVLACGEGTAGMLSYANWQGKYWIVHSDTSHQGRQMYWLTEYSGSNIVNEISLTAEYWENENDRYDENSDFSFAGESITMEEFERLRMELFGY